MSGLPTWGECGRILDRRLAKQGSLDRTSWLGTTIAAYLMAAENRDATATTELPGGLVLAIRGLLVGAV